MKTPQGHLMIMVGLPGSGKSHLFAALKGNADGPVADDFLKDTAPGSPIQRDPSITDTLLYPILIRDLRAGKTCVISDIVFCDTRIRAELEVVVRSDVRNINLSWEYFENNAEQCMANVRKRARKSTVLREINLIRFLAAKYFVPEDARTHWVWQASKILPVGSGKRPAKTVKSRSRVKTVRGDSSAG